MSVLTGTPLLPTYARFPVTFVDGEGCWLIADDGQRYLDLVAGIAVVSLGHCHPAPLAAAQEQLERLWHVSNLYSTEPMENLARLLSERFGGAHAFFCNSGTEAVEAAIKWARKSTGKTGARRARGLVPRADDGRALDHRPAGEAGAVRAARARACASRRPRRSPDAVGPETAAIFLEPVQGEGGVRPLAAETLEEARALADEHDALLVFDEVQTGVGRTGEFFAWQRSGVRPDAVTLAKGLANGLPIGALLVVRRRADRLRARRPRLDLRRQPRLVRRGLRRRRDDRRRPARPRPRDRRALRGAARRACAAPACCSPSSSAARPGRSRTRRSSTTCSSAPPATRRSASRRRSRSREEEADLGVDLLRETLRHDDEARAAGRDPPARRASATSPPRPSSPRRSAARGSTPCRRPSRATSPGSGS